VDSQNSVFLGCNTTLPLLPMHQNSLGVPSTLKTTNWSGVVGDVHGRAHSMQHADAPCSTHEITPTDLPPRLVPHLIYIIIFCKIRWYYFLDFALCSAFPPAPQPVGGRAQALPVPQRPRLHWVIHGRVRARRGHGPWIGSVLHVVGDAPKQRSTQGAAHAPDAANLSGITTTNLICHRELPRAQPEAAGMTLPESPHQHTPDPGAPPAPVWAWQHIDH
jgi:hypothetical protein